MIYAQISFEWINKKINQALIGSALSLDANIEIIDKSGYAPYENTPSMIQLAKDALSLVAPERTFDQRQIFSSGSTDMGDLGAIMPIVHPYAPGAVGLCHGNDYQIDNPEDACVLNAKWQLAMLYLLLQDNGERAFEIKKNFTPAFKSKEEYLEYCTNISCYGDRINYSDGVAQVKL